MSGLTCQKQLGAATAKDPSLVASLVCHLSGLGNSLRALPNIQGIVGAAIADIAISIRGALRALPFKYKIRRFTPARLTWVCANRLEASVQGTWTS
jgi:hypothetical protein